MGGLACLVCSEKTLSTIFKNYNNILKNMFAEMRIKKCYISITKQHPNLDLNFISIKKHEMEITLNFYLQGMYPNFFPRKVP